MARTRRRAARRVRTGSPSASRVQLPPRGDQAPRRCHLVGRRRAARAARPSERHPSDAALSVGQPAARARAPPREHRRARRDRRRRARRLALPRARPAGALLRRRGRSSGACRGTPRRSGCRSSSLVTVLVFWRGGLYAQREQRAGAGRVVSSLLLVTVITLAFAVGTGYPAHDVRPLRHGVRSRRCS